jgi:hypothetical protein
LNEFLEESKKSKMADEEPFQVGKIELMMTNDRRTNDQRIEHLLDWRLQDRSDLDSPLNDQENRIQYQIKYKVHWKGYPDPIHDTWEPKSSFASPYYLKKEVARLLLLHPQTLEPPKVLERRSKELQNEYDKLHPTASAQAKKIKSKSKNNAVNSILLQYFLHVADLFSVFFLTDHRKEIYAQKQRSLFQLLCLCLNLDSI